MKSFKYTISGTVYEVVVDRIKDNMANVEVNGTPYQVEIHKPEKRVAVVQRPPQPELPSIVRPPQAATGASAVHAPLPGIILNIDCKIGDTIKKGQQLMVLEAMKMENAINADRNGVIKEIKVNCGDSVLAGAELVIIE